MIIVEDDPYWYLQYPSANQSPLRHHSHPTSNGALSGEPQHYPFSSPIGASVPSLHNSSTPQKSSGYPFLDSLVPSYLSVDYQGRVVRLDTFSKTVAPGCRLGWITTQPALCERLLRITETSTQQPSGFVQSVVAELIIGPHDKNGNGKGGGLVGKGWQTDGWVRWLEGLRGNYERRMQIMCRILEEGKEVVKVGRRKCLSTPANEEGVENDSDWAVVKKTQLYSFIWPLGGMFIWLHIHFESHPLYNNKNLSHEKLAKGLFIHLTTPKYRVLASPGAIFGATDGIKKEKAWQYFRLCFAAVDEAVLEGMSYKLVAGIRSFWGFKRVGEVEELIVREVEVRRGGGDGGDGGGGELGNLAGYGC